MGALADACRAHDHVSVAAADELSAAVSLVFTTLHGRVERKDDALTCTLEVPERTTTFHVFPERGVRGALAATRELTLGDATVDAAFVLRGDDPPLLVALAPELTELAHAPQLFTSIHVEGATLTITFNALAPPLLSLAVQHAFAVWHRVAFFRM